MAISNTASAAKVSGSVALMPKSKFFTSPVKAQAAASPNVKPTSDSNPALLLQSQQRRVHGAFIQLEHIATHLLEAPRDAEAVQRSHRVQRLQDHEVQRPLQYFRCFPVHERLDSPLSAVTAPLVRKVQHWIIRSTGGDGHGITRAHAAEYDPGFPAKTRHSRLSPAGTTTSAAADSFPGRGYMP
jgi:hypothetical protein